MTSGSNRLLEPETLPCVQLDTSVSPKVRGTADIGAYSPSDQSSSYLLTTICPTHMYTTHVLGPTGSDGHEGLNDEEAGCAPFSLPFVAMGWCTSRAPCDHLVRPPT